MPFWARSPAQSSKRRTRRRNNELSFDGLSKKVSHRDGITTGTLEELLGKKKTSHHSKIRVKDSQGNNEDEDVKYVDDEEDDDGQDDGDDVDDNDDDDDDDDDGDDDDDNISASTGDEEDDYDVGLGNPAEDPDHNEASDERLCQICLNDTENGLLRLIPCRHRCICEPCYLELRNERTQGKILCPVCMQAVDDYRTKEEEVEEEEIALAQKKHIVDVGAAKMYADALLAGTHIEKVLGLERPRNSELNLGILEVSETDLQECFGIGVMGFFRQTRYIYVIMFIFSLFSVPLVLTFFTSVRQFSSEKSASIAQAYVIEARRWSVSTCIRDDCQLLFEPFLIINASSALLTAIIACYMGRVTVSQRQKETGTFEAQELNIASRSLLVIQAPHRTDAVKKKELQTFFKQLQLSRNRKRSHLKDSYGERTRFAREVTPPIIDVCITGLLNYSSENLSFARAAEERIMLVEVGEAERQKMNTLDPITKEFRLAKQRLKASIVALKKIEQSYFRDLFLQEELGAVARTAHHKVDFLFITFKSAAHASLARELMHHDNRHWILHHLCLMFGAPLTRLRAIGTVEEVYPSNIDWFRLQHPHWYGQSGWPARCALLLVTLLIFNMVIGYYVWDVANDLGSHYAGAAILVLWNKGSRFGLSRAFDWYGHPLRSFTIFYSVLASTLCIDVPCYLLWPFYWSYVSAYTRKPFSYTWWSDRVIPNLVIAQTMHTILQVVWFSFARNLYLYLRRELSSRPLTQQQMNKRFLPPTWDLAQAYMSTLRTVILCVPYSGIVIWLAPLGGAELFIIYLSEKKALISLSQFPVRSLTSQIGVLCARITETCIILRLVLATLAIWVPSRSAAAETNFHGMLSSTRGLNISTASLVTSVLASFLVFLYLHRFLSVRRFMWRLVTLDGLLLLPWKWWQDIRRSTPGVISAKKALISSDFIDGRKGFSKVAFAGQRARKPPSRDASLFDMKRGPRYRELFCDVQSLEALQLWSPEPYAAVYLPASPQDPAQTPILRRLKTLREGFSTSSSSST